MTVLGRGGKKSGHCAWSSLAFARGVAFFFGLYAVFSLISLLLNTAYNANIWWIGLLGIPELLAWGLQFFVALALLAFSFKPPRRLGWRIAGSAVCALFAALALRDAVLTWLLAGQGVIRLGILLPFSLFIMLAFVGLALAMFFGCRCRPDHPDHRILLGRRWQRSLPSLVIAALAVAFSGLAFSWGQILCFGLTDYRQPVDAVVIFGAQAYPDGTPSPALAGRVDAGIEMYQEGYTPLLIMSGATGWEGVDEAAVMQRYAVQNGVPPTAIVVDGQGASTELTVKNTMPIIRERGLQRVGAVSSFYHMARIKMLYLAAGQDVLAIPADGSKEGDMAVPAALREIPAWWYYWFKSIFGT
ncbi:MAG: YdcF family protein [Actinomycetia bacterium]|nr:YdcF family protein [Actinomycetes bacterium]